MTFKNKIARLREKYEPMTDTTLKAGSHKNQTNLLHFPHYRKNHTRTFKRIARLREKYEPLPDVTLKDGSLKKMNRFFPSFKKKSKGSPFFFLESHNNCEDTSTVALSPLSSAPSSPFRAGDSCDDSPLWTSTFDEEDDEDKPSSDMLLIFTSATTDTEDLVKPLSISSFSDESSGHRVLRTPPMQTSLPKFPAASSVSRIEEEEAVSKQAPTEDKLSHKSMSIDFDASEPWADDDSHWVSFMEERKDSSYWEWNGSPSIDWGVPKFKEVSEPPSLSTTHRSFDHSPKKDISDEASTDSSTVSIPLKQMIFQESKLGDVEVYDPECPLRLFSNDGENEAEEEPPQDKNEYPFVGDIEEEENPSILSSSFAYYQHQMAKLGENHEQITKRLHQETLALIGSVSEKAASLDEEARFRIRSRWCSPREKDRDGNSSIASTSSAETKKKTNTSYFSTEGYEYPPFGFGLLRNCNVVEPFVGFGQAEI